MEDWQRDFQPKLDSFDPHLLVTILNPGISFKATLCVRGSPISRRFPPKGVILTFYSTRKHFK